MRTIALFGCLLISAGWVSGQVEIVSRDAAISASGEESTLDDSKYARIVSVGTIPNAATATAVFDRNDSNPSAPLNVDVNVGLLTKTIATDGFAEVVFETPTATDEMAVLVSPGTALSATSGFSITIDGVAQQIGQYALDGFGRRFRDIEPLAAGVHSVRISYVRPASPSANHQAAVTLAFRDPSQPHDARTIRWKAPANGEWEEARKWQDNLMPTRNDAAVFDVPGFVVLRDSPRETREIRQLFVKGSLLDCVMPSLDVEGGIGIDGLVLQRAGTLEFRGGRMESAGTAIGAGPAADGRASLRIREGSHWSEFRRVNIGVTHAGDVTVTGVASVSGSAVRVGAATGVAGRIRIQQAGVMTTFAPLVVGAATRASGRVTLSSLAGLGAGQVILGDATAGSGLVELKDESSLLADSIDVGGGSNSGAGSAAGGRGTLVLEDTASITTGTLTVGNILASTAPRATARVAGSGDGAFLTAGIIDIGRFSKGLFEVVAPGNASGTTLSIFSRGTVRTSVPDGAVPSNPVIELTATGTTPVGALAMDGNSAFGVGAGTMVSATAGGICLIGGGIDPGLAILTLEKPATGLPTFAATRMEVGNEIQAVSTGRIVLKDGVLGAERLTVRNGSMLIGTGTVDLRSRTAVDDEFLNEGQVVATEGPGSLTVLGPLRTVIGGRVELRFKKSDARLDNALVVQADNPGGTNFQLFGELVVRFTDFKPRSGDRYRLVAADGVLDSTIGDDFTLTLLGPTGAVLTVPAELEIADGRIDLVLP